MNTSPVYIRAAEDGIADARQRGSTEVYSFGMEAVRNCGYQNRRERASQILHGRSPTSAACFLTFINVRLTREERMHSFIASNIFKERLLCFGGDIKPLLTRKIASICVDIIISYSHTISTAKTERMKELLEGYSNQLVEEKQVAAKANEELEKKNIVIQALIECRAHDEESRTYDEESIFYTEKLIDSLKELLDNRDDFTDVRNPRDENEKFDNTSLLKND